MDLANVPCSRKGVGTVHFQEELDPQKMGLDIGIMHFETPLLIEGDINYADEDFVLEARVEGVKVFSCSRCLERIAVPFEKNVILDFVFDRSTVNVLPELSEELRVDSPIHVLCKEDCKGLCSRCGTNLNQGDCHCHKD